MRNALPTSLIVIGVLILLAITGVFPAHNLQFFFFILLFLAFVLIGSGIVLFVANRKYRRR